MGACIIAEIGQAHEGSLGQAHAYIDALAQAGVDAIKFQMHIAEAESSLAEPFRVLFSQQDTSRFEYWKRMSFSLDQWKALKQHCDQAGVEFLCTPFSNTAVDWLEALGVARYKVGSGDTNNFLILEKIANTKKDIIISSGMSNLQELDETVAFLKPFDNRISLMQCVTKYPVPAEELGLAVLKDLRERYQCPIGYSDHSGRTCALLAAACFGAELLEFHVVFDKRMFGPDVSSSITIDETRDLVSDVRFIETSMKIPSDKNDISSFKEGKQIFGRSLAINKNKAQGEVITFDDLEAKKPSGQGLAVNEYKNIVGKRAAKSLHQWDFLQEGDYE